MKWHALLGIGISLTVLLAVALTTDLQQLWVALRSANYGLFLIVVGLSILTLVIRAWRWQYLMRPIKVVSIWPLFSAMSIGFMANMLLPAHAGEVVRAYLIGRNAQVNSVASFATIVVERLFDMMTLLFIVMILLFVAVFPGESASFTHNLRLAGYGVAALCVASFLGLWLIHRRADQVVRFAQRTLAFLPEPWVGKIVELLLAFALGLQVMRNRWHLTMVISYSLLIWGMAAFGDLLLLHAFDLQLPAFAPLLFLVVQVLGVTVPSGPGFIGTYHAAVIGGFALFGIDRELALSVAIVMHAAFFFPFIAAGCFCLWRDNMSLRTVSNVAEPEPALPRQEG